MKILTPQLSYLTGMPQASQAALENILLEKNRLFQENQLSAMRHSLRALRHIHATQVECAEEVVRIGTAKDLTHEESVILKNCIEQFAPWRKGPFELFGQCIDAEWKSDLKWQRFQPHIEPLQNARVADIGSNNGYFLFRMSAENPEVALGFEPTRRYALNFHFLHHFTKLASLHTELLGYQELAYFQAYFSHIFLMGILYHHSDPIRILKLCHQAMQKGGQLLLETMGIAGNEEKCIFPKGKYAGVSGVYFIPDQAALFNMLHRAGFRKITCIYNEPHSPLEQRTTAFSGTPSFAAFIEKDTGVTIEGYPPVHRIYFICQK